MMKLLLSTFTLILIFVANSYAQSSQLDDQSTSTPQYLESLFGSGQSFEAITAAADAHFETKYPGVHVSDLCAGEHRDGNYVKYQRWKSFWKDHLAPDGSLGDFTKAAKLISISGSRSEECSGDEYIIEWTNPNYTANMGVQIDQGRTSAMAFHPTDPNVFYVGAAFGGLWKTTDGGLSYEIINDELPLAAISGIAIDPIVRSLKLEM